MNKSHAALARETMQRLDELEEGATKCALAEEAVRLADLSGHRELRIETREALVAAATFAGRMERSMTAFAWTLANYEDEEWARDAVWVGFHWVSEDAPLVHTIERSQLDELLEQMEDVFRANNWWMYPVHMARFRAGIVFGERPGSLRSHLDAYEAEYQKRNRSSAHYDHVRHVAELRLGELGDNYDITLTRLAEGEYDEPPEYPHRTHALAAFVMHLRDDVTRTRSHFERARTLCGGNQVFLRESARLLVIAAERGWTADAVRLVEQHLVWTTDTWDHWSAMMWHAAAAHVLGITDGRVRPILPPDESRFGGAEPVDAVDLAAQLWAEARRLAEAFDARNANATWSNCVEQIARGESPRILFTSEQLR